MGEGKGVEEPQERFPSTWMRGAGGRGGRDGVMLEGRTECVARGKGRAANQMLPQPVANARE